MPSGVSTSAVTIRLGAQLREWVPIDGPRLGPGSGGEVAAAATPDEWIEAEATFTDLVWAVGAPVPRVLGIECINGRSASIYERIDGRSMWEQMVEEPGHVEALARSLAALQAHVFSLVPPAGLPAQHDRVASKIRDAADRFDAPSSPRWTAFPR